MYNPRIPMIEIAELIKYLLVSDKNGSSCWVGLAKLLDPEYIELQ